MGGSVSMRLQFILSEIWVALRRNLSMSISVALVTMVSVLFLGLGVLAQRQVDTMKDYWYDRVQVSIFLCTAKSDLPNCSAGAVTDAERTQIGSQLDAMKPLVKNVFPESQQQAYDRLKAQYKDSSTYREITPAQMPESFRVQLSDPTTSLDIVRLLDRINRAGTTIVMATHDNGIVDQLRKRVLELDDGELIRDQMQGVYGGRRFQPTRQ